MAELFQSNFPKVKKASAGLAVLNVLCASELPAGSAGAVNQDKGLS